LQPFGTSVNGSSCFAATTRDPRRSSKPLYHLPPQYACCAYPGEVRRVPAPNWLMDNGIRWLAGCRSKYADYRRSVVCGQFPHPAMDSIKRLPRVPHFLTLDRSSASCKNMLSAKGPIRARPIGEPI
jgi:hypothetical protein